jgi:DNA-binding NarL/FixJ family response regulator
MTKIRVLLADDHEIVRQGLKLLIDGQTDMQVVGEAGDGETAVERAKLLNPDVAVLDISMPKVNGLAAARNIVTGVPGTAVVALTRYRDVAYVKELLAVGAIGYVLKQSPSTELLAAIRAAAHGKRHLDTAMAEDADQRSADSPRRRAGPMITERERDVLRYMALGHSNKEIGQTLGVSVKTVEVHKANGMRKLRLTGRIDVIRYAQLQGWLSEP